MIARCNGDTKEYSPNPTNPTPKQLTQTGEHRIDRTGPTTTTMGPRDTEWPERRWKRKWSEIIDSLIRSLIGPGHVPELGQDRPAQDTDVATAALEAKMVRNHRFFNRKFNSTGTRARTRPGQARPGEGSPPGGRNKDAKRDSQESVWTWPRY